MSGWTLSREEHERLLHGRVLSPLERLERARSALEAAADGEARGWCPPSRVEWQEREVRRLEREAGF